MLGDGVEGRRLTFESDFRAVVPFDLRPVPVINRISPATFWKDHRKPAQPAILRHQLDDWAALRTWPTLERMVELVGADRSIYCRLRKDPAKPYAEDYVPTKFGSLIDDIRFAPSTALYLTQALIHPPSGFCRLLNRLQYPAFLEELAVDCPLPDLIDPEYLMEGVLWIGAGQQVTRLHFDDQENLVAMVNGRKRWLLFPHDEATNLLAPGANGRVSSLEQLTEGGAWRGGPVQRAYLCETQPGDLLYLPAGYLHQVYSADEPNAAVNFWYIQETRPRLLVRVAWCGGARRFGFRKPVKRVIGAFINLVFLATLRLSYALRRGAIRPPRYALGPTSYTTPPRLR